jgi:hypothetical protein
LSGITDDDSGLYQMRFSNDNIVWSDWETYDTTKSWTLVDLDGLCTVYSQFSDNAENISDSISDTITLDRIIDILLNVGVGINTSRLARFFKTISIGINSAISNTRKVAFSRLVSATIRVINYLENQVQPYIEKMLGIDIATLFLNEGGTNIMENVAVINVTVNGITISGLNGLCSLGQTDTDINSIVSIVDNSIVFTNKFSLLYIQPEADKSVQLMIGGSYVTATTGFNVTERGLTIPVVNSRVSLATSESTSVSIIAIIK